MVSFTDLGKHNLVQILKVGLVCSSTQFRLLPRLPQKLKLNTKIQSNLVITNSLFFLTVNIYNKNFHWGPQIQHKFVRYKREFAITVIVIAEFDFSQ
jgi:hypothetical protein